MMRWRMYRLQRLVVFVLLMFLAQTNGGSICKGPVCEFHLHIRHVRSMSYFTNGASYNVGLNASRLEIVATKLRLAEKTPLVGTVLKAEDVITLDGIPKTVIAVNEQFPGPTIEVMEGTEVVVHVTNLMKTEGTSIHWHGLYQKGTPWMDGTAYVSQCLIQPHQTFTYRFTATPAGTHWYHSHVGAQRMDGLFGMFIVHKNNPQMTYFPLLIQDWYEFGSSERAVTDPWGPEFQGTGERHLDSSLREYAIDGVQIGAIYNYTGLINGRGRKDPQNPLPLTQYQVLPNQRARFHSANVGGEYAWEISVDQHKLFIVASDGYDINPTEVDSFIVEPGETMDFEIAADQVVDNYWLRGRTIRATTGWNPSYIDGENVEVKAVLRYTGADQDKEPTSSMDVCTQKTNKCKVFNCNFPFFADKYGKACINYVDVKSGYSEQHLQDIYGVQDTEYEEYFLNFAFSVGSSVNARRYRQATTPMYQNDSLPNRVPCDENICDEKGCTCTHVMEIPKDKTVQLVMSNLQPNGQPIFGHHPVHLHGTGFAVMKIGYADHDLETGHWTSPNTDVQCEGVCANAHWRNGIPVLNSDLPVVKDTVVVPARGYVVVRFKSTNPGYWFMHCHVEQHVLDGMNMVLNVGPGDHPPLPAAFPQCGNYSGSLEPPQPSPEEGPQPTEIQRDKDGLCSTSDDKMYDNDDKNGIAVSTGQFAGIIIGSVALGGVLASVPIICLLCLRSEKYSP